MMYEYNGTIYNLKKFARFDKMDGMYKGKRYPYIEACTTVNRASSRANFIEFRFETEEERENFLNKLLKKG